MVDRLILVKSCADCPLKVYDNVTYNYACSKTGKNLGVFLEELKLKHIPDWCPLTYAKPKGFGPVPNKHEIHDTRPGPEC